MAFAGYETENRWLSKIQRMLIGMKQMNYVDSCLQQMVLLIYFN